MTIKQINSLKKYSNNTILENMPQIATQVTVWLSMLQDIL